MHHATIRISVVVAVYDAASATIFRPTVTAIWTYSGPRPWSAENMGDWTHADLIEQQATELFEPGDDNIRSL